jgi:hypothetical protein
MRRPALLAIAALVPLLGTGTSAHATGTRQSTVSSLVQRMVRALDAQQRIRVSGLMVGPGSLKTRYQLRYEAQGKEFVSQTGGPWSQVRLPGSTVDGVEQIIIGRRAYRSMDGRHWYHTQRKSPPVPLDAMSLNIANVPCCVAVAATDSVRVVEKGATRWNGHSVLTLEFTTSADGYEVSGTVLVDVHSYLPLRYTQSCKFPEMNGTFALRYGGQFLIAAP